MFKCKGCNKLIEVLRRGKCLKCYRIETGLSGLRKENKCSHIKKLKKQIEELK